MICFNKINFEHKPNNTFSFQISMIMELLVPNSQYNFQIYYLINYTRSIRIFENSLK